MNMRFQVKKQKRGRLFLWGILCSLLLIQSGWAQQRASEKQNFAPLEWYASNDNTTWLYSKTINVLYEQIPLAEALVKLANQAGVRLSYDQGQLPDKMISLSENNITVIEAFKRLFEDTGLNVLASPTGQIVIKKAITTDLKTAVIRETVSGLVTDAQSGETLPGVNVILKSTTTGTSTDSEGNFELNVPSLQDTLIFSFVGYQTREVPIDGRMELEIQLTPQAISGEEVVVIGYGEQQERDLTSSITSVSGTDIAKIPATNIGNSLFGTSGLQITQTTSQPGQDDPSIFVRGVSSLGTDRSQPLFVLDGVVVQDARAVTRLDPDNIASVSVLKDASATAVYGVEGANGVIIVETKRGQEGPMNISVNTSAGLQAPTLKQKNMGSYTYARAHNEAQLTDGVDSDQLRFTPEAMEAFRTGSNPLIYPSVDWVDYLTKPAAFQSRTNINISGGTEDVRFFVAGGYLKQDGFMKDFETDAVYDTYENNPTYDRYNLRSNLDIDVTPSTQLSITGTGRVESRIDLRGGMWGWNSVYESSPFGGAGFVNGKRVVTWDNRYIPDLGPTRKAVLRGYGNGYNQRIQSGLNLSLSGTQQLAAITEGLELQLKGTYNADFIQNKFRSTNVPLYVAYYRTDVDPLASGDSTIVFQKIEEGEALTYSEDFNKDRDWYLEARLQYSRDFGSHSIEGLLLAGQRKRYYPSPYPNIPRQLINTVGRINYNYDDRYLLEASMGYNGSENFAKSRRFGFFPAVSGGWILTNEPYFPEVSFLNFLKLRASYGLVGNDTGVGRFLYLSGEYNDSAPGYNFGHEVPEDNPGAREGDLGNPEVTWETARKQNYGIDLHMFEDRLDLSFDYFYEFREDILTTLNTVPSYVSADLPAVNIGEVENRGYEVQIKWQQQIGDFFYSVGGTVTHARNTIVEMDEVQRNEPYQQRTGQPVGQPFGWTFDGFYSEEDFVEGTLDENLTDGELREGVPKPTWTVHPGFLKYKDLNGDGVIDDDDTKPIGYSENYPEYSFGADLNFGYKNIDLSLKWTGATHVSSMLFQAPNRVALGSQGQAAMRQWQWDGRWTPEKDPENILFPRLSLAAGPIRNQRDSDFWLLDASYIRLKHVELGYTLERIASAFGAQSVRVYVNAYNPLTFSDMMATYGIDPEQTGRRLQAQYPIMKVYNMGLKFNF